MKENKEKENPNPSRMRGRGVEVSKTLFYEKNWNIWLFVANTNFGKELIHVLFSCIIFGIRLSEIIK